MLAAGLHCKGVYSRGLSFRTREHLTLYLVLSRYIPLVNK